MGSSAPPHQGVLPGRSWLGSRDLRNFCRGLKPELVESQGPRERSRYPKGAAPQKGGEEQVPGAVHSLPHCGLLLLSAPPPLKSCCERIYRIPPPNFPGFSHCLFASGLCIGILKRFNLGNMVLDLWELVYLGSWECAWQGQFPAVGNRMGASGCLGSHSFLLSQAPSSSTGRPEIVGMRCGPSSF